MDRRTFLAVVGTTFGAGCSSLGLGGDSSDPTTASTATPAPTPTPTPIPSSTRTETSTPTPATTTAPPEPASFQADVSLPASARPGSEIELAISVRNTGGKTGTFVSVLSARGPTTGWMATDEPFRMTLDPGKSRSRSVSLQAPETEGTFSVRLDDAAVRATTVLEWGTPTTTATPTATPRPEIDKISLLSPDSEIDDPDLTCSFNHGVQYTIAPTDADGYYEAGQGKKFLIVACKIHNRAEYTIDLTPQFWNLKYPNGTIHSYQPLDGYPTAFTNLSLAGGGRMNGWIPYEIPVDLEQAHLVLDQSVYVTAVPTRVSYAPHVEVDVPTL